MTTRPSFIRSTSEVSEHSHVYPQSSEQMGPVRRLGKEAGLQRIGINIQRLPPGARSSWPHAEENEEEFVYVIAGVVDAWVDGNIHTMIAGDLGAFPVGTGISHCLINNSDQEVVLLVGGECRLTLRSSAVAAAAIVTTSPSTPFPEGHRCFNFARSIQMCRSSSNWALTSPPSSW